MMTRRASWTVSLLVAAFMSLFFLWPVLNVLKGGFFVEGHWTWRYLVAVFANPVYREGLVNSFALAVCTTATAFLLAVPLAWLTDRYGFRGKTVLCGLLLVPMVLPPFVGAIGFQRMLGPYGALNALLDLGPVDWLGQNRFLGVVVLQSLSLYPILYLNAAAALANVDPAMEEAAASLGGSGFRLFRRITLPLMMPGLFAGGTVVFIWALTDLGTPLILNYERCASVQVYDALKEMAADPFPYALISVLFAVSVGLYVLMKWTLGRHAYAMQGKATVGRSVRELRGRGAWLAAAPLIAVTAAALLPHIGVVLLSFGVPGSWYGTVLPGQWTSVNYVEALGHDMTLGSIRNSLLFSLVAVVVNLVVGIAVSGVIVRSKLRLSAALDALVMMPLAVPGLILAFGYLSLSSSLSSTAWVKESPWLQQCFDVRVNPTLFLILAYAVRRLPYVVRSCVAGLQQTSEAFEEAAASVGAAPGTVLRRITLPLIVANVLAGLLMAFALCMLEVSDSLMLAQRAEYYPITKTIYELFQLIGTGEYLAAALGVWAMVFLAVALVGSSAALGKKLGMLFRV